MWNVILCDDEPAVCTAIGQMLHRFCAETKTEMDITVLHSGEALMKADCRRVDLILLDIRMNGLSGMDAARQLRAQNNHAVIIFITSMTEYALEGYAVHAFSFLKKPLQYEQLHDTLWDALRLLQRKSGLPIPVEDNGSVWMLNTVNISYFEAFSHTVYACLPGGRQYPCSLSLTELEERLGPDYFRCHKSYLVNFRCIQRQEQNDLVLDDGTELPLSRHRRKKFMEALATYCGG